MVLIPVFWTTYTTTAQGRALKIVRCENCSTEYVYILEREATGIGNSMSMLNEDGAADHSQSAAGDTLKEVLANDFDPVPCPACGHYQTYMFPKLMESKGMGRLVATVALLMIGGVAAISAVKCSVAYLRGAADSDLNDMVIAWSVLLPVALLGLGIWILNKRRVRQFNPNAVGLQERLAIGRHRAVTREEFERVRQEKTK